MYVKGTIVHKFFQFFEKSWKIWFQALVSLTHVKGTSMRKKDTKRERCLADRHLTFGSIFDQKSITNRFKHSSKKKKRSPQNSDFDAKGVPKWSQIRYENSSNINAKTGNEKYQ